jgi:hypothetical protein
MKERLIQLINAFSAARVTGDPLLQQYASKELSLFLDRVEIVEISTSNAQKESADEFDV